MPTARDALLEAARDAVESRPWPLVRMVEVAAAAGVSRQTLYNEFGDKAGLGTALAARQVTAFLDGFGAHLADTRTLAGAADWIVAAARGDRLVRACLVGCDCGALPPVPQHPGRLVSELRDRALHALGPRTTPTACETAIRLALSHLIAPPDHSSA